ncbi:MAG: flagellar hook-length control protein FliK [Betaproteobacteria bacterium]|nr:flagellar hook-length control protein FliK [Betaproteobacteria bacterium]
MAMITALPLAPPTSAPSAASASAPDAPGECGANAPAFAQALRDAGERLAKPADTAPSDDDSGANLTTDAVALAGLVGPWVAPVAPAIVAGGVLAAGVARGIAGGIALNAKFAPDAAATPAAAGADATSAGPTDFAALGSGNPPATTSPATAGAATATTPMAAAPLPGSSAMPGTGAVAPTPSAATATPTIATTDSPLAPPPAIAVPAEIDADRRTPTATVHAAALGSRAGAPDSLTLANTAAAASVAAPRATSEVPSLASESAPVPSPTSITAPSAPVAREAATLVTAVATAVATPGWHEDIAQKFAQFVSMRVADAEIRLNPAHLGPVGIEISYSDNQASVLITAAQPTTRDALEQALPHLKELLAQQGIALGESSVRDQRDARADSPSPRAPGSDAAARPAGAPMSATETHRVDRLSSRLIDTFA